MGNAMMNNLSNLVLATAFLAVSTGAQAGLQEGIADYDKGQYQAAAKEIGPLAAKGDTAAQLYLGKMYMQGQGAFKSDYAKAISWTRKAANRKNAEAQYFLGFLYYYGMGTPQNYTEALLWYRKAAEHGNAGAQASLGSMFAYGQGVPQDMVLAYKWFKLAAALGEADAAVKLKAVEDNMTPLQIKEAEALAQKWLEKRK